MFIKYIIAGLGLVGLNDPGQRQVKYETVSLLRPLCMNNCTLGNR